MKFSPESGFVKPPVVIVPYDSRWPGIFEIEKAVISDTLGEMALIIEHIGSTSVHGLGAKDIVDIMAGVKNRQAAEECRLLLEAVDFTEATPVTPEPGHDEWFYCLGKTPGIAPRVHLHLVKYPSPFFNKHILFRDYLRTHPGVARDYYELKKRLADEYGRDREGYTNAKSEFIEGIIDKAVFLSS